MATSQNESPYVPKKCANVIDESRLIDLAPNKRTEQDEMALSTLFIHLSNSVIQKIGETNKAFDLWATLEKYYHTKTLPNKDFLWSNSLDLSLIRMQN